MRELFLIMLASTATVLAGCSNEPVEYNADNSGGYFHQISTDPAEIFRNKINHEADLEARGVEPPVGNMSWREYWTKIIDYYTNADTFGTRRQVAGYVIEQRRARSLPPL